MFLLPNAVQALSHSSGALVLRSQQGVETTFLWEGLLQLQHFSTFTTSAPKRRDQPFPVSILLISLCVASFVSILGYDTPVLV